MIQLSDAYHAYGQHLKRQNDSSEKRAFEKTRGTKVLETRLKEAGYELRALRKGEQVAFDAARGEQTTADPSFLDEQPGAAAAAGPLSRRRGGPMAGGGGEATILLANRRWLPVVAEESGASAAAASHPRPVAIMGGGLPRTNGPSLTKQLDSMLSALGGRFTTHNSAEDRFAGGALVKLVFWFGQQRQRDRNPAAVPDADMEEYRPPPPMQIHIQKEAPMRKRAREQPAPWSVLWHSFSVCARCAVFSCSFCVWLLLSICCVCVFALLCAVRPLPWPRWSWCLDRRAAVSGSEWIRCFRCRTLRPVREQPEPQRTQQQCRIPHRPSCMMDSLR